MIGRKSALWLTAAAISVLAFVTMPAAASAEDPLPCNTAVELCNRTLDQVVLPGTHNSMSNEEYGWNIPNQTYSIPTQLQKGIRAFLIDTHYGKPNGEGVVSNIPKGDRDQPGVGTYLCHEYCALGASPLVPELAKVKDFLAANPREVLVFVVQDGLVPEDLAAAVTDSGLLQFVYQGSTATFPTLAQMIADNQRVVMLSEGNTGDVPWYHNGYAGPMQETPYDFRENEAGDTLTTQGGIDLLTTPATLDSTCRPNRGGLTGSLFLMNHWVNGLLNNGNPVVPDHEVAKILNAKDVLVNRAKACQQRRGKLPTIIAVDQFGDGDLLGAVDELNGVDRTVVVPPPPDPIGVKITVKKPKTVRTKAGRVAVFRVPLSNMGDTDSARFRVCAKAPKRLVRRNGCTLVALKAGQSKSVVVRVPTKPKAGGKGKVTFTVYAPDGKRTTKATLVVKKKKKGKARR